MSQRFYVNGVQIFGNNEMFENTHDEIARQGGVWDDVDLCLPETEIIDPQALMDAVEKDSLEYLKKILTKNAWSERKNKCINRPFSRLTDKHILLSEYDNKEVLHRLYTNKGEVRKNAWRFLQYWVEGLRIFTGLNLYNAIKSEVEFKDGKLVLKDGGKIIAEMF